jgi:type IV pilus assembly protein PilQ
MIALIALSLAVLPPDAALTGLSVVAVDGRTEVVIELDGEVSTKDFLLSEPSRIVVDLTGIGPVNLLQRKVERGGVMMLRAAPFGPGTVRVVIDLEKSVEYRVDRAPGAIRVSFPNTSGPFEAWSAGPIAAPAPSSAAPTAAATTAASRSSTPGQAPAAANRAATPAQAPTATPVARRPQRPITVTFTEEPLSNVVAAFADYAGRSIVPSSDIKGQLITAEVRNQDWEVALQVVLAANNLYAEEVESGVIMVKDASKIKERQSSEPLISRQYKIEYVSADSLVAAVQGLTSSQGAKAVANRSNNSLIITETPSVLNRIEPLLQQLDVREPQVNISATIAFVDRTALEQLGVTYDVKDSRGNQLNRRVTGYRDANGNGIFESTEATQQDVVLLGGNSIAALGNANYPVPSPALQVVTSLVLGRHTLITFLEALQSVTLSDVQAKPVVTVMNHRQASIQVGQETPIRVIDAGAMGAGGGGAGANQGPQLPIATVEFKNTGIILQVTPHVTGNQVLLDMHAERSDAVPASSDIGVVFTTQNATTQVLVNDGETAVIGGLTVTEKSRVRTGIPLLMDLPVIGALFRNTREEEKKRDLLIMVTPHIIRN